MTNGMPSASTSLSVGTVPPIIRMITGGESNVFVKTARAQVPSGESSGVWAAFLTIQVLIEVV